MHRNHHPSSKCTPILPLTHEFTEIIIPQVNAPKHMNSLKSSSLEWMHRDPTPHTWMNRNRLSSGKCNAILPLTLEYTKIVTPSSKCTGIIPLTHECTEIAFPKVKALQTTQEWIHRNHHPSNKCTGILPLTHEWTEIVTPQVNAPQSYPSHMNAPKS